MTSYEKIEILNPENPAKEPNEQNEGEWFNDKTGTLENENNYDNKGGIGSGSFGKVYKILKKDYARIIIAMKVIDIENCCVRIKDVDKMSIEEAEKDIKEEIITLKEIASQQIKPNCFPEFLGYNFYKTQLNTTKYQIFMGYLPQTLKDVIKEKKSKNQKFEFSDIFYCFKTLLNSLAFLQKMNICHRDLKPANILAEENLKNFMLIDFGLSKNVLLK